MGNRGDNAKTNNLGPKNIIYEQIKKKSIRKEKKEKRKKEIIEAMRQMPIMPEVREQRIVMIVELKIMMRKTVPI